MKRFGGPTCRHGRLGMRRRSYLRRSSRACRHRLLSEVVGHRDLVLVAGRVFGAEGELVGGQLQAVHSVDAHDAHAVADADLTGGSWPSLLLP